jgi:hypothetical protein
MKAKLKKRMKLPLRLFTLGRFRREVFDLSIIREEDTPKGKLTPTLLPVHNIFYAMLTELSRDRDDEYLLDAIIDNENLIVKAGMDNQRNL